jgi:hypothetical protein
MDLNPRASWAGQGNSVNNLGVVAGTLFPLRSVTYPYPLIGTTYVFISYNGGPVQALTGLSGVSYAYCINDLDQVVGNIFGVFLHVILLDQSPLPIAAGQTPRLDGRRLGPALRGW